MEVKYYDIGVNLFCRQFKEPGKIIKDAADNNVCCILTGTDSKENSKIDEFVKRHEVFGTAGIHPHNADQAKQEDFQKIEKILFFYQTPWLNRRNTGFKPHFFELFRAGAWK